MRREHVEAWLRDHVVFVDTVVAIVLFSILLPLSRGWWSRTDAVLVAGLVLPLVARRAAPVLTFTVIALVALEQGSLGSSLMPADLGLLIALYSVAAYGSRLFSWSALAVGLLGVLIAVEKYWWTYDSRKYSLVVAGLLAAMVLGAWIAGDLRRTRLLYEQGLRERANQLERERDQQGRLAASAERARIAREMHDVVAHGLSVIIVQADGGLYAMDRDPDAGRRALATIGSTGREALAEMRTLLGLLRSGDQSMAALADHAADRTPQPGLDQVPDLVRQVTTVGLPVELDVRGPARAVPLTVGLTAYRVVQEALTNALRHAGPGARASVVLQYAPDSLEIRVQDDGRGAASLDDGAGLGLVGMRERVSVAGGAVRSGPRPGGGYEVIAMLPTPRPSAR